MVVLSAAIVTTSKALLARQFVEMTRLRVEGLIGGFQRLVDVQQDRTFIETETVRYVYQPIASLHLVVITNTTSNILQDRETLRLLCRVVQERCSNHISEKAILDNAIDIVLAFDEVISFGHRESTTLAEVKACTDMQSYEEQMQSKIEQHKINETREIAKKKQFELQQRKYGLGGVIGMEGFGSDAMTGSALPSDGRGTRSFLDAMPMPASVAQDAKSTAATDSNMPANRVSELEIPAWTPAGAAGIPATIDVRSVPKKSMVLKRTQFPDVAGLCDSMPVVASDDSVVAAEAVPACNSLPELVSVRIREKVTASLDVDGSLSSDIACHGAFDVVVPDSFRAGLCCFKLEPLCQNFRYKVHPGLDKASYAQYVLEAQPAATPFPAGECLKWQLKTREESFLPVSVACWPTPGDILIEVELTDKIAVLEDVTIALPVPAGIRPHVASASLGEANINGDCIVWRIAIFDSCQGSATLQLKVDADMTSMLPVTFTASECKTRCPIEISQCYHQASQEAIEFACERRTQYELRLGV